MAENEVDSGYQQDITGEFSIRINDLEEKTKTIKEKTNLISKNFIFVKQDMDEKIEKILNENSELKKELKEIKRNLSNLSEEAEKWIRRDEIVLIERMLKDFQPLEFVRKSDFQEMIKKINQEGLEKNKNPKKL